MHHFKIGDHVKENVCGPVMRIIDLTASNTIAMCQTLWNGMVRFVAVTLLIFVPYEMTSQAIQGFGVDDYPAHAQIQQSYQTHTAATSGATMPPSTTWPPRLSGM
jgi:hypothetical protein